MAFLPIAHVAINYRDYSSNWVKAYEVGTTTPKVMALESDGSNQVAKLQVNIDGFLVSSGNALVIPYIDGFYDMYLFPTEAEADANNTTNALKIADNIIGAFIAGAGAASVNELTTATMTANTNKLYVVGDIVNTVEFSTGNGGGATYDVVLTSGVTPNTVNILIGVADATISFVLRLNNEYKMDVSSLGIAPTVIVDLIPDTIAKSAEIVAAMVAVEASIGKTHFTIAENIQYDGQSLYDNIPSQCIVTTKTVDTGYSYAGYVSKGDVFCAQDTQDEDSRTLLQSGHHAVLSLQNAQLPNTGNGGVGQSTSSLEGKCTITFSAGYQTVNGREIPGESSRLQRYQTAGTGPIHLSLQLPTETDVGTRTLFDFNSDGNASFGGSSIKEEYNLFLFPDNTNTPAGDKHTVLAMRQIQPSSKGCTVEMVSRDLAATNSMAINYLDGLLSFLPTDALQGGYTGRLEQALLSADLTLGEGRLTISGSQAVLKPITSENKSIINAVSTLSTGMLATQIFVDCASTTVAYFFLKFMNHTDLDVFTVDAEGDVTATSYSPFTGCHYFYSDTAIDAGCPVDLTSAVKNSVTIDDADNTPAKTNGIVAPSGSKSKICAGVVKANKPLVGGGFIIVVAAVGDNVSGELIGFKVNDESGVVEAGDILCTSSTVGELMKLPDGQPESVVRFKAMAAPDDDNIIYGYFK